MLLTQWLRADGEVCMTDWRRNKRAAKVGPVAAGHPGFCSQPRRERQGISGVCHCAERECGRNAGGDAPAFCPPVAQIRLEIPSAPVAALALLPKASRNLRAKALRTTPAEGYYLLGLKFARPLLLRQSRTALASGRKIASAV